MSPGSISEVFRENSTPHQHSSPRGVLWGCYSAGVSSQNNTETPELSEKKEEISVEDKKVVAEIKPISKKKTEDS